MSETANSLRCQNQVCGRLLLKYSYWIGKAGPYCASCAKFIGHIKESKITRNLSKADAS